MLNQTLLRHVALLLIGCLMIHHYSAEDCRYQLLLPSSCYIDNGSRSDANLPCTIEACSRADYTCDYIGTGKDFSYLVFYCNTSSSTKLNCTFRRTSLTLYSNFTALFNVCLINEATCNILTQHLANCVINSFSNMALPTSTSASTNRSIITTSKIISSLATITPAPLMLSTALILKTSTTEETITEWIWATSTNSTVVDDVKSSDKTQLIIISVSVPLAICIIASLIVGVIIWRRRVRKTSSQRTKSTKVVSARNNITNHNNLLQENSLAKEVQSRNKNNVYNHPESRDSNYINSSMSQYAICTEKSVNKKDVSNNTYGNNLIECIVSPEITTNKTVLSKRDREKHENETDRNELNSQHDSHQPTESGYCEISLLDDSLQDVTDYSRLSLTQDKHHTYEKLKK